MAVFATFLLQKCSFWLISFFLWALLLNCPLGICSLSPTPQDHFPKISLALASLGQVFLWRHCLQTGLSLISACPDHLLLKIHFPARLTTSHSYTVRARILVIAA